jgi:hypothetical protein
VSHPKRLLAQRFFGAPLRCSCPQVSPGSISQAVTLLSQWQLEATVSHPEHHLVQRFFGAPLRCSCPQVSPGAISQAVTLLSQWQYARRGSASCSSTACAARTRSEFDQIMATRPPPPSEGPNGLPPDLPPLRSQMSWDVSCSGSRLCRLAMGPHPAMPRSVMPSPSPAPPITAL